MLFDDTDIRSLNEDMYGFEHLNLDYVPVVNYYELNVGETFDDIKRKN